MPVTTDQRGESHQHRIEQQAESLIADQLQGHGRQNGLLVIAGGETSGKSALLRELDSRLRGCSRKPILVNPPAKELDAGPVALLQLGVGLRQHGVIDGGLAELTSQELDWTAKIEKAQGWLAEFSRTEEGVLLLDEPLDWPSRSGEEQRFRKPAEDVAQMLLADVGGETVAGVILFRFGKTAWFMIGASTDRHRNCMPNYALQWEAICWAKSVGCTTYDMWGAPDILEPEDELWGVWRFKEGFGAQFAPHIGAHDYATSRLLYWVYQVALPRYLAFLRRRKGQA